MGTKKKEPPEVTRRTRTSERCINPTIGYLADDWQRRRLTEKDDARFEKHLAQCKFCQGVVVTLAKIRRDVTPSQSQSSKSKDQPASSDQSSNYKIVKNGKR